MTIDTIKEAVERLRRNDERLHAMIEKLVEAGAKCAAERDAQTARADAADAEVARLKDENERLRSLVDSAHGIFANCEVSAGVCCCGENMDGHSNPMECGHSPVDMGDYSAGQWLASIQRKAGGMRDVTKRQDVRNFGA